MIDTFQNHGIDLHPHQGQKRTTCPECSPDRQKKNDRCLSVDTDNGTWICHHCGWTGGLSQEKQMPWTPKKFAKPASVVQSEIPESSVTWFERRGISKEVLDRNQIGTKAIYMPQVDKKVGTITFPYFRDGELINVKYRDRDKHFRMEKGAERILFGLDDLKSAPEATAVIVEGEMDKLSIDEAFKAPTPSKTGQIHPYVALSVPDGAPAANAKNYESKFTYLDADSKLLAKVQRWIIAVDGDEPGVKLEAELSRRLGKGKCSRVIWPEDCKDANDVLVKHGPEILRQAITNAIPYPISGVFSASALRDKIEHLYEHGFEMGHATGWHELDKLYTVRPGEFTVVSGIPNTGKSNWLDCLLINLAKLHDWKFAVFSPENQPLEDHMSRYVEKYTGAPFTRGPSPRMTKEELTMGIDWVDNHFRWILPENDKDWGLDNIIDKAISLTLQYGIKGIVIDPWNEIEHMRGGMTEADYLSHAIRKIKRFSWGYGVHVWLVAHPTKLEREKDGSYRCPTMYNISGGAHWRNKADNGIIVHAELGAVRSPSTEIHVQKIRFRQIGQLGVCEMKYNNVVGTYSDAGFTPPVRQDPWPRDEEAF